MDDNAAIGLEDPLDALEAKWNAEPGGAVEWERRARRVLGFARRWRKNAGVWEVLAKLGWTLTSAYVRVQSERTVKPSPDAASIQDLIKALTSAAEIADRLGAVDTFLELRALVADAEDNQDA